mmetsp:Transcript_37259/g.99179  ORF Transcript_37259/g.99179 Transcript_37259/m.99179 type:complete len:243 (+) Transcript_37259:340-1068(+)
MVMTTPHETVRSTLDCSVTVMTLATDGKGVACQISALFQAAWSTTPGRLLRTELKVAFTGFKPTPDTTATGTDTCATPAGELATWNVKLSGWLWAHSSELLRLTTTVPVTLVLATGATWNAGDTLVKAVTLDGTQRERTKPVIVTPAPHRGHTSMLADRVTVMRLVWQGLELLCHTDAVNVPARTYIGCMSPDAWNMADEGMGMPSAPTLTACAGVCGVLGLYTRKLKRKVRAPSSQLPITD